MQHIDPSLVLFGSFIVMTGMIVVVVSKAASLLTAKVSTGHVKMPKPKHSKRISAIIRSQSRVL